MLRGFFSGDSKKNLRILSKLYFNKVYFPYIINYTKCGLGQKLTEQILKSFVKERFNLLHSASALYLLSESIFCIISKKKNLKIVVKSPKSRTTLNV